MMSGAPPGPRATPNDVVSDVRPRVVVSRLIRTESNEDPVDRTPLELSPSVAAHVVLAASVATGACALAKLATENKQTNPYTDTAYVFDVARIVVPEESSRCCSTIMPYVEIFPQRTTTTHA